jgi:hypothetical protein
MVANHSLSLGPSRRHPGNLSRNFRPPPAPLVNPGPPHGYWTSGDQNRLGAMSAAPSLHPRMQEFLTSQASSPVESPRPHWGSVPSLTTGSSSSSGPPGLQSSIQGAPSPPFNILFIADPTRYSTLKDAQEWNINYWSRDMPTELSFEVFEWLRSAFPKMVFRHGRNQCFIHEFVSDST